MTEPDGIIPAGAGRSPPNNRSTPPSGDHPRGCGEKFLLPAVSTKM